MDKNLLMQQQRALAEGCQRSFVLLRLMLVHKVQIMAEVEEALKLFLCLRIHIRNDQDMEADREMSEMLNEEKPPTKRDEKMVR